MNRKVLIGLGVVLLAAAGYGAYIYFKKAERVMSGQAAYSMTTSQLLSAFEQNEDSANKKYLNQIIEVTGNIESISPDSLGTNILLGTDNPMAGVNCRFDKEVSEKIKNLKANDSIKLKGQCTGFNLDVNLSRCDLLK
ncbi:MAG: hypothetical protein RL160_1505 [Bacteroidota bacterium]|jgi:hypothetical protein